MKLSRSGFIISMLLVPMFLQAQSKRPTNCEFLQKAFEDTIFIKVVNANTVLVDTSGYFKDCKITYQGKQLNITREWDSCLVFGPHTASQFQKLADKYKNWVIVDIIKQSENEVFFHFRKPSDGTEVESELKGKNKRIWVKVSSKYKVICMEE